MRKFIALAAALALLLALFACGRPGAAVPNPPLVLGEKYLFDMDYEQALLQFDQAIAIEPKNPRAWLGKYAALELADSHDEAVQTLRNAEKKASGDQISAALAAAEKSAEEGLLAVAEAYTSLGFGEIALKLLRMCVMIYRGRERFVAALSALDTIEYAAANGTAQDEIPTEAPATAENAQECTEIEKFFSPDGGSFTLTGSALAELLGCMDVENNSLDYVNKKRVKKLCSYNGPSIRIDTRDYDVDEYDIHTRDEIMGINWSNPSFSVCGLKPGDARPSESALARLMESHGFVDWNKPDNWDRGYSTFLSQTGLGNYDPDGRRYVILICLSSKENVISNIQVILNKPDY